MQSDPLSFLVSGTVAPRKELQKEAGFGREELALANPSQHLRLRRLNTEQKAAFEN